ncbi:hypothetical protein OH77DRAFT_145034 [Trametes cingulata]|nr:hypothetical protein OH77DRAFT_145034 [Trametes cingulata]
MRWYQFTQIGMWKASCRRVPSLRPAVSLSNVSPENLLRKLVYRSHRLHTIHDQACSRPRSRGKREVNLSRWEVGAVGPLRATLNVPHSAQLSSVAPRTASHFLFQAHTSAYISQYKVHNKFQFTETTPPSVPPRRLSPVRSSLSRPQDRQRRLRRRPSTCPRHSTRRRSRRMERCVHEHSKDVASMP